MPCYDYVCDNCGHEFETFRQMKDESVEPCPVCANFRTRRIPSLAHTDLKEFSKPIEMYSIALNDDEEIKEFKRNAPDVEVSMDEADPMYGIPIARNRKQKLAANSAMGFHEKN